MILVSGPYEMQAAGNEIWVLLGVFAGAGIALVAGLEVADLSNDLIRTLATYAIAGVVLLGAFLLIYQGRGDSSQAWLAIGSVIGFIFRDAGGAAAASQAVKIAQANAGTTPP